MSITRILPSTVRRGIGVAGAGFLLVLASHPAWSDTPEHIYSFAIVPQHKATDLARHWTPLLQYLNEKTGYRFEFRTARDIPTFEQRLMQSEYDVAYLNPLQHVVFRQTTGYRAIARESGRSLHGILVVRADSPYHTLRDLQGQTLAFPAPSAFAASLLTRARLRAEDVRIMPSFVVSHDSVYYGVANGLFAAGGGARQTLDRLEPKVREKLRMLWMSEEYPPHPFVVHPRVPAAVTAALLQTLTGMGNDARGRRLLAALGFHELVRAGDEEYEGVRKMVPGLRAEICALPESYASDSASWLCAGTPATGSARVLPLAPAVPR